MPTPGDFLYLYTFSLMLNLITNTTRILSFPQFSQNYNVSQIIKRSKKLILFCTRWSNAMKQAREVAPKGTTQNGIYCTYYSESILPRGWLNQAYNSVHNCFAVRKTERRVQLIWRYLYFKIIFKNMNSCSN